MRLTLAVFEACPQTPKNPKLLHSEMLGGTIQTKTRRAAPRVTNGPLRLFQCGQNVIAVEFLERPEALTLADRCDAAMEVAERYLQNGTTADNHGALNDIFELTDILEGGDRDVGTLSDEV